VAHIFQSPSCHAGSNLSKSSLGVDRLGLLLLRLFSLLLMGLGLGLFLILNFSRWQSSWLRRGSTRILPVPFSVERSSVLVDIAFLAVRVLAQRLDGLPLLLAQDD
jgi:hypothetical protein